MNEIIRKMKSRFKKAYQQCDFLEDEILKKRGIFFRTHKHTIEELMNSEYHRKIDSITKKIGSDISYWRMSGKLSSAEEEAYYAERENIDDILHQINRKIRNREPTLWEKISQAAEDFIVMIMDNLPILANFLTYIGTQLGRIPYIGKVFPILIYGTSKTTHLLTDSARKFKALLK